MARMRMRFECDGVNQQTPFKLSQVCELGLGFVWIKVEGQF